MPTLNLLQKNLVARSKDIGDICERNIYSIKFLLTIAGLKKAKGSDAVLEAKSDNSDSDMSDFEDQQGVSEMDFETNWNE